MSADNPQYAVLLRDLSSVCAGGAIEELRILNEHIAHEHPRCLVHQDVMNKFIHKSAKKGELHMFNYLVEAMKTMHPDADIQMLYTECFHLSMLSGHTCILKQIPKPIIVALHNHPQTNRINSYLWGDNMKGVRWLFKEYPHLTAMLNTRERNFFRSLDTLSDADTKWILSIPGIDLSEEVLVFGLAHLMQLNNLPKFKLVLKLVSSHLTNNLVVDILNTSDIRYHRLAYELILQQFKKKRPSVVTQTYKLLLLRAAVEHSSVDVCELIWNIVPSNLNLSINHRALLFNWSVAYFRYAPAVFFYLPEMKIEENDHKLFLWVCKNHSIALANFFVSVRPDLYSYEISNGVMVPFVGSVAMKEKDIDTCSICYSNKCNVLTNCEHPFCLDCVTIWSRSSTSHGCPICREPLTRYKRISLEEVEEVEELEERCAKRVCREETRRRRISVNRK